MILTVLYSVFAISLLSVFFFFSSRRRHTRYIGDWSSDVCSSDLTLGKRRHGHSGRPQRGAEFPPMDIKYTGLRLGMRTLGRSEERRVGKECRSRWWRDH